MILFFPLCNIFFNDCLYIKVNGRNNSIAVRCFFCDLFHNVITVDIAVFPAVNTIQIFIVLFFYAPVSDIAGYRKTDDMARQPWKRIFSLIFTLKGNPFYIWVIIFIIGNGKKCLDLLIGQLFLVNQITPFIIILNQLTQLFFIITKAGIQGFQGRLYVFLILQNQFRIQNKIIHFDTGRQGNSVSVQNISALKRQHRTAVIILCQHLYGIFISFCLIQAQNHYA